jgi:hypothetical protein
MPGNTEHPQHRDRPPGAPLRPEQLVTVETQQEHDLFTGKRVERLFIKLYLAARTSGLLAAISDRDFKTLCVLATYMDKDGYCYPSQTELARALGVSRQMANERLQSLAAFRFQGRAVMLMPDDQDRGGGGTFGGKRYQILPIAGLSIFNRGPRETHEPAVSSGFDTAGSLTVSSPTVTVPLDTAIYINKKPKENKKQQQEPAAAVAAPPTADTETGGSDVVVSSDLAEECPSGRSVASPRQATHPAAAASPALADDVDALGLVALVNDLVTQGVAPTVAQKWLRVRTPEYVRKLLEYHDWCQIHRKGFIHDSGAWLAQALAEAISFPDFYLKAKEGERRRAERRAAAERERTEREAEERRQLLEDLARDPDDDARRKLEFYERSREAMRRPPLTEQERREHLQGYKTGFLEWRDKCLAEEPDLARQLRARTPPPSADRAVVPDPGLEAKTAAELREWQRERKARGDAQAARNEAARVSRSPRERAEAALRGLDDQADALGQPRLTGSEREHRRAQLVAEFAGDGLVPIGSIVSAVVTSGGAAAGDRGRPFVHRLTARRGSG